MMMKRSTNMRSRKADDGKTNQLVHHEKALGEWLVLGPDWQQLEQSEHHDGRAVGRCGHSRPKQRDATPAPYVAILSLPSGPRRCPVGPAPEQMTMYVYRPIPTSDPRRRRRSSMATGIPDPSSVTATRRRTCDPVGAE